MGGRKYWLIFALLLFCFSASTFSSLVPVQEHDNKVEEQKRRVHRTTSSSTSSSSTSSMATAIGTCTQVAPTGTPLLANSATNKSDGPEFLGYIAPKGSGAKLSAVSIHNQTTNQTFLVLPSRTGMTFSFVSPDGLVFTLDRKLLVKTAPQQSCSLPSSFATTRKRGIEPQLAEKRQVIGPLVGGTSVALDVTNPCGQPVTGLSPTPGAGTLRLLFSCDLVPGQYLGFNVPGVTPYVYGRMAEASPGHYTGYCPFPPYIDLSMQKLCINGIAATTAFCDVVSPSVPLPLDIGLRPALACFGLVRLGPQGLVWAAICEGLLLTVIGFCKVFTNSVVQNALCGPPPTSALMNSVVTDLEIQYVLADQVSIQPTGPPVPVVLGPYEVYDITAIDASIANSKESNLNRQPNRYKSSRLKGYKKCPPGICSILRTPL